MRETAARGDESTLTQQCWPFAQRDLALDSVLGLGAFVLGLEGRQRWCLDGWVAVAALRWGERVRRWAVWERRRQSRGVGEALLGFRGGS